MKAFKITLISFLCAIDLYLLYSWIGYLILGANHPKILGEVDTTFMGMYIMSITFFVLFAVLTLVIILLSIRFFRKNK